MILRRGEDDRIDETIAYRFRWVAYIEHELDALLDGVRHTGVHWIPAHQIEDHIDLIDLIAINVDGPIECDVQMGIITDARRAVCVRYPGAVHILDVRVQHLRIALRRRCGQLAAQHLRGYLHAQYPDVGVHLQSTRGLMSKVNWGMWFNPHLKGHSCIGPARVAIVKLSRHRAQAVGGHHVVV